MKHSEEIISILQEEIAQYDNRTRRSESGTILEIGDGIATVYGLDRVVYGELVEFETGARGIALNLERDSVGVVLLGSEAGLHEGSWVKRTGRPADVPVGEELIGRTVNALGEPIDGLGPIASVETRQALDHGKCLMEILKQPLHHPMAVWRQAVILYIATSNLLSDVPLNRVNRFVQEFADSLQAEHGGLVEEIQSTGTLPGAVTEQIRGALEAYKKQVSVSWQE